MSEYSVLDTLATQKSRHHLVRLPDGSLKGYDLKAEEPTKMPMEHALKFLRDDHFVVLDEKGARVKPQPSVEHFSHVPVPSGFVMAKLEELSREALYKRCKLQDGSEDIHPLKSSRDVMVAFLQGNTEKPKPVEKEVKNEVDFGDEEV